LKSNSQLNKIIDIEKPLFNKRGFLLLEYDMKICYNKNVGRKLYIRKGQ